MRNKKQEGLANPPFPIVGVGASAGGLTAFRRLLGHIPADTGMAFVLVQHLHPKRKSALVELLATETRLPVFEAQNELIVKPNHVYVIPPNKTLAIDNGVLYLTPRAATDGLHTPIDHFLRSLAEDREDKAIGIVLSGTGTDGSIGLEEIKARGGITFAQDPDTADHGELPMHAIVTGSADYVLSPEAIAGELLRIGQHPHFATPQLIKAAESPASEENKLLSRIFILLRIETGIDYSHYKTATILRRIARRMAINRIEDMSNYVDYLVDNPAEVEALSRDMLITVTDFFRDPEVFETLKTKVFPNILQHKAHDESLRIWVPGCSTGEEVYSLAISLLEFLETASINPPIQIFGTDIKEEAIEVARQGIYPESAVGSVSKERLERFFTKVKYGYQIKSYIREMCVFARHNVTKDPPFSRQDLISFRNVLIYLGPALQKKIIPVFHYALQPWGYLLLGASETVGRFSDLFALIDKKHKIFLRKQAPVRLPVEAGMRRYVPEEKGARERAEVAKVGTPTEVVGRFDLWTEASHRLMERYSLAGVIVDERLDILQFHGNTEPYLRLPSGKASLNLLDMTREGLALELQTAIYEAKISNMAVGKDGLRVRYDGQTRDVNVEIVPIKGPANEAFYFILFKDVTGLEERKPREAKPGEELSPEEHEISRLTQEIATAKEYLQAVIDEKDATNEELRAANEEIQSTNEELQSINEELETAKEELQSANEELTTVNEELQINVNELAQLNDDLNNLLVSVNIPIIMLGSDLSIRRFTPGTENVFAIAPGDIGRPIGDIKPRINISNLESIVAKVIDSPKIQELEVQDADGNWYSMQVRPYKTGENKIDGAVITFVDIDALKRSLEKIKEAGRLSNALNEVNASITSTRNFNEIMQTVVVEAAKAIGCSTASIEMRKDGYWEVHFLYGLPEEIVGRRFNYEETVGLEIMVKTKKPFAVSGDNVNKILRPSILETYKVKSMLLVPVIVKGEVVAGMRFVYQETPVTFTEAQIDFANKLATSVSLALENSRLFGQLEHALSDVKESRRQVLDILESISDGFFSLDSLWRITYINSRAQELFGMRKEDVLFKTLWDNLPNAKVLRLYKELQNAAERQTALSFEEFLSPLEKWFEFNIYPYAHGVSVYFTDITERKLAEEALRESQDHLNRAQEIAHLGSWELDLVNNVLTWSDEVYRIFGLKPQEFGATYEAFLEYVHPDDRAAVDDAYTSSIREGRDSYEIEHRVVREGTGEIRIVHEKCQHFRDAAGKIIRSVGMVHDVTERKRAEEALKESEQRVRAKLESILSPEGDIGDLELADIIDSPAIESLIGDFYRLARIPMSIIDLNGKILVGVGWQDICTRFHRAHPDTCRHCMESDLEITKKIPEGEFKLYKCKNGMWDAATPLMVGGKHMGNLFTGQFFFNDEPIDLDFFRTQARKYGFNEAEYINALEKTPRISREMLDAGMAFYLQLADTFSKLSYSNIKLARSLAQGEQLVDKLEAIHEITAIATSSLNVTELSQRVINDLGERLGLSYAGMFILNEEQGELVPLALHGYPPELHQSITPLKTDSEYVVARGFRSSVPITAEDVDVNPPPEVGKDAVRKLEELTIKPFNASITLPLMAYKKTIGVISLVWPTSRTFSQQDVEFFTSIAHEIAVGLENARLHEQTEEELAKTKLLQEVAVAATSSVDLHAVTAEILASLNRHLKLKAGDIKLFDKQKQTLGLLAAFGYSQATLDLIKDIPVESSPLMTVRPIRERRMVTHSDEEELTPERVEILKEADVYDARYVVLPVEYRGEVVGTFSISFEGRRDFTQEELDLFHSITHTIGQAIENARLYEKSVARANTFEAVLQMGSLITSSLSMQEAFSQIVGYANILLNTPVSVVMILDNETKEFKVVASEGISNKLAKEVLGLADATAMNFDRPQPSLVGDLSALSEIPFFARAVEEQFKSAIISPLLMQTSLHGLIIVADRKELSPSEEDMTAFRLFSNQAMSAIKNAERYEAERDISDVLQGALLAMPQRIKGIRTGSLYRSATEAAQVGGDFYDIFEIEHGKVGLLVGDVSGKGIEAASLTAVVRNVIKAHTYDGGTPGAIMSKTNDTIKKVSAVSNFITVFFGILDTATGELLYCSAGHPPAIIKRAQSGVDLLEQKSPVIGAFTGLHYSSGQDALGRGDIVILYTDGITEARRDDEFFQEDRLVSFIKDLGSTPVREMPQAIFHEVMDFTGGKLTDDVAILTVSLEE